MEIISVAFACGTIILAIIYIRRLKRQINNVENAFRQACGEINRLKNEESRKSGNFSADI
jgi:hypothetical protein